MANANIKAIITAEDRASPVVGRFGGTVSKSVFAANAAFATLNQGISKATNFLGSSVTAANRFQGALIGLTSVAGAFGQNTDAANQAAKNLAADGLMTVSEAATSLKNLLASGFSLDQAVTLMNRFKDSAAFGRQAALGFGESIRGATEGIKNGNSILVDNAGVTKNLSVILEEAGFSAQDLMKATTDASVRQALFNGILRETAPQMGDASKLTQTFAGEQARAAAQTEVLKQQVGGLVQVIGTSFLSTYTSFIGKNQQSVGVMIMAGTGATIFGVAILGLVRVAGFAITAISTMTLAAAALNVALLAVTVVAGVILYKAFSKVQGQMKAANDKLTEGASVMKKEVPQGAGKSSDAMQKLAARIADINEEMTKTTRNFREQLAEMIQGHQGKVESLKKQIGQEETEFKDAQTTMTEDHQSKVDDIKRQIDSEVARGRLANQQKIADLQSELAKENKEYEKQNLKDTERHNTKLLDLQTELQKETDILTQHAADVASVRDVQLLDEIDKLKRSHTEQMTEFEKQKQSAIENARQTTAGISGVWDSANANLNSQLAGLGSNMGREMGNAFKDAIKQSLVETGQGILGFGNKIIDKIPKGLSPGLDTLKTVKNLGQDVWSWFDHRAAGGPVNSAQPYIVGENGPELFVPKSSGDIVPNNQMSGSSSTINVTFSGVFAADEMEFRKLAVKVFRSAADAASMKNRPVGAMV